MTPISTKFLNFLQEDLAIPAKSIALAMRAEPAMHYQFSMILWQYGFVNKQQLEHLLDWLEYNYL